MTPMALNVAWVAMFTSRFRCRQWIHAQSTPLIIIVDTNTLTPSAGPGITWMNPKGTQELAYIAGEVETTFPDEG